MIDFTNLPKKNKTYVGANGSKICVVYNGEAYMIKFPPTPSINKELSYTNSCISEYIGCHIVESLGIPVQETMLGIYHVKGKEKIVVACKDFAMNGLVIQDFASLKNQIIDSESKGRGTDLEGILETIDKQNFLDSKILNDFFWDTFIADAFIGNWDRHNGNWGFLYNVMDDSVQLAPLWDCGSCLYPQSDERMQRAVLMDQNEMNNRIYVRPTSAISMNGKRINYFDFISSGQYNGCTEALKRIIPKIDLDVINQLIDNIECITQLQKTFYKTMLEQRKIKILDKSLEILLK